MNEAPKDHNFYPLTEQEYVIFQDDINNILGEDIQTIGAKQERHDAINHLAVGLNDAEINSNVAEMMIECGEHEDTNDIHVLYAYASVINKANEIEEFKVPSKLIVYVTEIAKKYQEDDIASEMSKLRMPLEEIIGSALLKDTLKDENQENSVSISEAGRRDLLETTKDMKKRLLETTDEEEQRLGELINESSDELDSCLSPDHAGDVELILEKSKTADDIYNFIKNGNFKTTEGLQSARAWQDMERLEEIGTDEEELFENITMGRFLTTEGINAAVMRQDFQRLISHYSNADDLLRQLKMQRFFSKEAISAAEHRQDSLRLSMHMNSSRALNKDLLLNYFLTEQGRTEAVNRIAELEDE
jgi:hypothetical protein